MLIHDIQCEAIGRKIVLTNLVSEKSFFINAISSAFTLLQLHLFM